MAARTESSLSSTDKQMLRDRILNLESKIESLEVDPRKPAGISSGFEAVEIHFPISGVTINFGSTPTDIAEGVYGKLEDITISTQANEGNTRRMQYRLRRDGYFTYESIDFRDLNDGRVVIDRDNDLAYIPSPKNGPVVSSPINEKNVGGLYSIIKTIEQPGNNLTTVLYANRWAKVEKGATIRFSF